MIRDAPAPLRLVLAQSVLRPWKDGDQMGLVRHANNVSVARNLRDLFPHPYTLADANAWISRNPPVDRPLSLAIEIGGEVGGGIGLTPQVDIYRHSAEVGYWLGEAFWGRGIMTEAVAAFSNYAFETWGFHRLYACVFARNAASARVLEKAGYVCEGLQRQAAFKEGVYQDEYLYARLRG